MARQKTDRWYFDRVARYALSEGDGKSASAIIPLIERDALAAGRRDAPSERTIRRLYREVAQLPEQDRRQFALFAWPRSMEIGVLPWEAAPAALALLKYCAEADTYRPTNSDALWFSRLRLAAPTLPVQQTVTIALELAAIERAHIVAKTDREYVVITGLTTFLAFEPWLPENVGAYQAAIALTGESDYSDFAAGEDSGALNLW